MKYYDNCFNLESSRNAMVRIEPKVEVKQGQG